MERKLAKAKLSDERAALLAKQEEQFKRVFEETYKKANPDKFKNQQQKAVEPVKPPRVPSPLSIAKIGKYDPAKALENSLYRFYWRKRFKAAGLELPPELQVKKCGRHRINEENAEKLMRFKERKKLEEAGEPVPPELQRQSHANKRYMKDIA
jgi:hypothetical protein